MVQWSPSGARVALGLASEVHLCDPMLAPKQLLQFDSKLHCMVFASVSITIGSELVADPVAAKG